MTKVKTVSLIVIAALFVLSACNLPNSRNGNETSATVVIVRVNAPSEYRTGPGTDYSVVGMLNPGQEVEAVGISPNAGFLLIRDPANPAALWWLKSEFTTVISGNLSDLPISPLNGGCPTPVGGGPTPVNCGVPVVIECPTPVGGGPTPVDCATPVVTGGCPTPIGGGSTPVNCGAPVVVGGCPTPIGGGPTPVNCGVPAAVGGCPTPIGGGPTPVNCGASNVVAPAGNGCPTPVGGGPTPVDCSKPAGASSGGSGCPTPIGGGPTPVNCSGSNTGGSGSTGGSRLTPVKSRPTKIPNDSSGPSPVP